MTTRLCSVVFDALDLTAQAGFWSGALGWRIVPEFTAPDEVVLEADDGSGLEVIFGTADGRKSVKNRVHLDLAGGETKPQQDELVERLIGAGARRIDIGQGQDAPWVVLADPEGNELCVSPPGHHERPGSLVAIAFDAQDPHAQAAFWAEATGWVVEAEGEWGAALRAPGGGGPALTLGPPAVPKAEKNRVHLDVAPRASDDQAAEVARLEAAGARRVDIGQGDDVGWVVLADAEGNEFCVLTPR